MRYKVFIFGTCQEERFVRSAFKENTELVGYLDHNKENQGTYKDGKPVLSPLEIKCTGFDYIVISSIKHIQQIKFQLEHSGIPESRILSFFFPSERDKEEGDKIFSRERWEQAAFNGNIKFRLEQMNTRLELWKSSALYEMAGLLRERDIRLPNIKGAPETINLLIEKGCSLCRFGDGEFEMMRGRKRPLFQKPDKKLGQRLREVFDSHLETILVAIPNQFGSLAQYTDEAADGIREYMKEETRVYLDSILDYEREYFDAYVSRPYLIYRDKEGAQARFAKIKQIWNHRDVVIVEGSKTRMGVGNDLLDQANSIKRIIGPAENAFDRYLEILEAAKAMGRDKLFLLLLGPTATVLAYDLALEGYQAIDMGHIDIEYEWFLRGVDQRVDIPGKYVNEVWGGQRADACDDMVYLRQIATRL